MKTLSTLISILVLFSVLVLSNAAKNLYCELPPIEKTLDTGNETVSIKVTYTDNVQELGTYSNTFPKGTGDSFFNDSYVDDYIVSVFNSGQNLHIEYKVIENYYGVSIQEDCLSHVTIPIKNTIETYYGGLYIMGERNEYQYIFHITKD
ncbi:hypothetical protein ACTA71_003983 [Dictyostelium dimigraforme]